MQTDITIGITIHAHITPLEDQTDIEMEDAIKEFLTTMTL